MFGAKGHAGELFAPKNGGTTKSAVMVSNE